MYIYTNYATNLPSYYVVALSVVGGDLLLLFIIIIVIIMFWLSFLDYGVLVLL